MVDLDSRNMLQCIIKYNNTRSICCVRSDNWRLVAKYTTGRCHQDYLSQPGSYHVLIYFYFFGARAPPPQWASAFSFTRFLDHTQRRATVGRTPLQERSARRRYLYLTTHNSQHTYIHVPGGIRNHNLSRQPAADLRLKPRGHWDHRVVKYSSTKKLILQCNYVIKINIYNSNKT
jgi:hypothetical protein